MNFRKLTPSMSLLLAFEAAARHQSFTRAAEELALSQSAVSRQVRTLEAMLGVELFVRSGKRITPTTAGCAYMMEISRALALVRNATLQAISSDSIAVPLSIATLPTFGTKWLMPKLSGFYQTYPDIQIDLHSRTELAGFSAPGLDAAIVVGDGRWPDIVAHQLCKEELVLIGTAATIGDIGVDLSIGKSVRNHLQLSSLVLGVLEKLTLLRVNSFPGAWREWCYQFGISPQELRFGPCFELTSHLIQAVTAGIGIGLVPRILVEDELKERRLLSPFPGVVSSRCYHLIYPERTVYRPALIAFRDWLLREASME